MGKYSIVVSIFFAGIIIFYELTRTKKTRKPEIITFINITFFLCFSITPILVYYYFDNLYVWTRKNAITEIYYFIALVYALLSYIIIVFFYEMATKTKSKPIQLNESLKLNTIFAISHSLVGGIFLLIFIHGIGGMTNFFITNTLYRTGNIDVSSSAFSRNLALFIPIATFIHFYNVIKYKLNLFSLNGILLIVNLILSIAIYYNRSGRLSLIVFFLTFYFIYSLVRNKNIYKYILISSPLIIWFIAYGKSVFNYFFLESFNVNDKGFEIESVLSEFIFPFYSLANAIKFPFFGESPRFFVDILYGVINLFPSVILPFEKPKTVTMLNTESFGGTSGIPIDLISLGFHSFGLAGVMIISIFFGYLSGYTQKKLLSFKSDISYVFYAQLIFFISLRIPYSEPTNVLKSNFSLILSFILFLLIYPKKK